VATTMHLATGIVSSLVNSEIQQSKGQQNADI